MGSRTPHVLVDTTPAKTIVVYRNGDQFYVGRKFVLSRRRVATFEALLEQLTEQVQAPFGVRRLFTPTRGHPVRELDALQAGGKYVAAGRERFKKLDATVLPPRGPRLCPGSVKPVVHCDISVPSRWQTSRRLSRPINVFTNGRLFFPPVKIIIPRFCLTDWNCVLAVIGEKVFPLGGVRKLFTMNGHLLEDSKELQDNHFYVAVGLETFKRCPYWKSPRVPKLGSGVLVAPGLADGSPRVCVCAPWGPLGGGWGAGTPLLSRERMRRALGPSQRLSSGLCPVSLRSRRGGLDGLPGQNSPEFPWATHLVPPVAFVGKASVFPPPSLQAWGVPVPSPSPVVLARRRKLSGSLGSWAAAPDEPLRV
uniref:Doublecortin domain-containing protein n=1 Tax=Sus scrofa TaxID=9823 RepID=A0A8D1K9S9_PIG